ncbi:arylamine N-acetyltransferase [Pandoraea nosoerga]|uniref:N-hydroxyarylamine O-acetyltransferase n=1 Tax=Pandoraea nosoerga TaxID=2508296 RepID=A0A5E4T4X2_9BURK|nr:arylamine N-acetyltransferase [Pandoraea nosoerga]MBN4664371.1 arylamine N-acetyltransferase [Pandoraea nosoerga]MBN4675733.1 arylamine N-acetyltransferase [Pandoraea nosoerga]MBN4679460.1 arylamine N-acetyltransferase [Pandoraea nosoerga]MBN4743543.1 arylamine N-acetyltransferase [Pandoraea nosoerga]VVD81484.1 N-hydroxyarylamine O-acetyltransferase [Pandoraea nosoerga]
MSRPFDPERYFQRIGYTGPRAATLDVLRAVHALHPRAIPFENLDPIRGRPVEVDLPSVAAKLVDRERGGYCFEHNTLFANVLAHLGFRVTPLIGRVAWGRTFDAEAPLTHMLLRVDLDGQAWLVDVGFGSVTLTAPLRLHSTQPQSTVLETLQLDTVRTGDDAPVSEYRLSVQSSGKWLPVYRFTPRPAEWIDYKLGNWYTSSAPESIFRQHLMACRVLPQGRIALLDTRLIERSSQGEVVAETDIASAAQLAQILSERFGLSLDGIDAQELFERAQEGAAKSAR